MVKRYIDADAYERELRTSNIIHHYGEQIVDKIHSAPSIEIVRCEECKHKEKCTMVAHHLIVGKGIKFVPITYCSAGERQTERSE